MLKGLTILKVFSQTRALLRMVGEVTFSLGPFMIVVLSFHVIFSFIYCLYWKINIDKENEEVVSFLGMMKNHWTLMETG